MRSHPQAKVRKILPSHVPATMLGMRSHPRSHPLRLQDPVLVGACAKKQINDFFNHAWFFSPVAPLSVTVFEREAGLIADSKRVLQFLLHYLIFLIITGQRARRPMRTFTSCQFPISIDPLQKSCFFPFRIFSSNSGQISCAVRPRRGWVRMLVQRCLCAPAANVVDAIDHLFVDFADSQP